MNTNPMALFSMAQQSKNPKQFMINLLSQQNSPVGQNLMQLAQSGDTAAIEQVARNLCKSRGVDFDTEFKNFRKSLGI